MIKKSAFLIVLFFTLNGIAQNNISPYSFFGVGEMTTSSSVIESSMAIGGAQNSIYQLHFTNPASYASLRLTTYAFAGSNKYISVDDGSGKETTSSFNLSFLALGFPVGQKAGVVFGVQPTSKVGYAILNNVDDTKSNYYSGEGGLSRVFLGYGHKLPYNFSLGLEGSYNFGNTERRILTRIDDVYLASMYETKSEINGFSLKLGVQNSSKINEKLTLKSGVTVHLENDLQTKDNEIFYSLVNIIDPNIISGRDVVSDIDYSSEINSPLKTIVSLGVANKEKWFAGVEYTFQDPILFKNDALQTNNVQFTKFSKIALGGFYTPKATSLTNYFQRITYRAGIYSKNLGLKIKDANNNFTEIKDFGMSFGLTLPSKRKLSNINLGIDIGQKGENKNGLVKENYFNFRLSFSFTDKWFKKRKLN